MNSERQLPLKDSEGLTYSISSNAAADRIKLLDETDHLTRKITVFRFIGGHGNHPING
jgi:hypothetical protein